MNRSVSCRRPRGGQERAAGIETDRSGGRPRTRVFARREADIQMSHVWQLTHRCVWLRFLMAAAATRGAVGDEPSPPLAKWPFREGEPVRLFVLAGHRNMEGERAFVQELPSVRGGRKLLEDDEEIPFRYCLGGGYKTSSSWEALGPRGCSTQAAARSGGPASFDQQREQRGGQRIANHGGHNQS